MQSFPSPSPANEELKVNVWAKRIKRIFLGVLIFILAVGGIYYLSSVSVKNKIPYGQAYRLVNEKISQSASIVIYLPKDVNKEAAKNNIKFDPGIEGSWADGNKIGWLGIGKVFAAPSDNYIIFKPRTALTLNRHYAVKVDLGNNKILASDFLVAPDPQIEAIFPVKASEAGEDSKITIVFNRPMVPLTTIDQTNNQNIPIEILPKTEGKFKWISTNSLQFIPKNTLHLSSKYIVRVKQGFVSMDGLSVAPSEIGFSTRNLRYGDGQNYQEQNNYVYSEPIRIYFNQSVDLDKTKAEIKILDGDNKNVDFVAQYGTRSKDKESEKQYESGSQVWGNISKMAASIFGSFGNSQETQEDKSIIEIYNKRDKFGREKLWNTKSKYNLTLAKAYPLQGDINLSDSKTIDFTTTDIIKSWSADSSRSKLVSPEIFDPQGSLLISFFEDIDLAKSSIDASMYEKITYAQKCSEQGYWVDSSACQKIDDKSTIKITFKSDIIKPGDQIEVKLKNIVNDKGVKINSDSIIRTISVYKPLKISIGKSDDTLTKFFVCSNNPIAIPDKKEFKQKVKANLDYDISAWYQSYLSSYEKEPCPVGQFVTGIAGGFMPSKTYNFNVDVKDEFGQSSQTSGQVTTEAMRQGYTSLFSMQQRYSITSEFKTNLTFGAKNLSYVDVFICKASPVEFAKSITDYDHKPSCLQSKNVRMTLPEKYWINNYFDVDVGKQFSDVLGNYIITLKSGTNEENAFLSVTGMALAEKAVNPATSYVDNDEYLTQDQINELRNLYWVTDLASQNPVTNANISIYSSAGKLLESGTTNNDGVANIRPASGVFVITATKGKDTAVIVRHNDNLGWASDASNAKKIYIYTDKPLYRPEQKINIKGILRIGYDGNFEMFANKQIELQGFDSKNNNIFQKTLTLNDFGTFASDFTLDKNAPLGEYRICLKDSYQCAYFDILEYIPAAFKVSAQTAKDEYISKEDAKVDLTASYYFGAPVDNADVTYSITAQNYYFDKYQGDDWYNWASYDDSYYGYGGYYYGDRFISRGTAKTDKEGKLSINQKLDLDKMLANSQDHSSKIIVFDTTIKNNMGKSVSAQKSVVVHAGQFYIGARTEPYSVAKKQEFQLKVKTVDINGKNLGVGNITADIYKVDWVYAKRQESGGQFLYDWQKKKEQVKNIRFGTNNNGDAIQKIALDNEGEYEIELSARDGAGNTIASKTSIYVYGDKQVSTRPSNNNELTLKTANTNLKVGDQGEIVIESPYAKAKALIALERGKIFDYQIVDVVGSIKNFKFTAVDEYAPNVFVSVLLQSNEPSVKFGTKEFQIDTSKNKINLDIKSDKKFYNPGETVKLEITAKDGNQKPLQGEFSVAVVDLSVLALKGNPKKDPLVFFYNGFPLAVNTYSNIKNNLVKIEAADMTKGGSGGGAETKGKKARGDFRETAFWQANATTDQNGKAFVVFNLPDNLTTWQAEVLGVTKDTKLGVNYLEFTSQKNLMVVPLKPRFIIPGDTFSVGAQVFNQSGKDQTFKVSLKSDTLSYLDKSQDYSLTVKNGQNQPVYFQVKAPENITRGSHVFTISATGPGGLEDSVIQSIVINPNVTYETVATANYTDKDLAQEVVYLPENISKEYGNLKIRSSATLAVFLSDALNYLLGYPYGCTEQIASQLQSIAVVKKGLSIPNLADKFKLEKVENNGQEYTIDQLTSIGLAKIYARQNSDGGFSLWGNNDSSSLYATLPAIQALQSLKKANVIIDEMSLVKATDYAYKQFNDPNKIPSNEEKISIAYILMQTDKYRNNPTLVSIINSLANDTRIINDQLSNQSLAKIAVIMAGSWSDILTKAKINNALDNRVNIDSRGAFLEINKNSSPYFETVIGDTALYLDSLALGKRETKINDKILRWLLNSRSKDGAWGSTQNTLAVVQSFTDYLSWKKETSADFVLTTKLNGQQIDSFAFNSNTILDQSKQELTIDKLKAGDYNLIEFAKQDKTALTKSALYYDMGLKYYLTGVVAPRDEGFSIIRNYYSLDDKNNTNPLNSFKAGDVFRSHLEIIVPVSRKHVAIEDFIPAGTEIVDLSLATEDQSLRNVQREVKHAQIYPDFKELRDDRAFIYTQYLEPGTYQLDYFLRAVVPGKYMQLPAIVSEMYEPENFGRTGSGVFYVR